MYHVPDSCAQQCLEDAHKSVGETIAKCGGSTLQPLGWSQERHNFVAAEKSTGVISNQRRWGAKMAPEMAVGM